MTLASEFEIDRWLRDLGFFEEESGTNLTVEKIFNSLCSHSSSVLSSSSTSNGGSAVIPAVITGVTPVVIPAIGGLFPPTPSMPAVSPPSTVTFTPPTPLPTTPGVTTPQPPPTQPVVTPPQPAPTTTTKKGPQPKRRKTTKDAQPSPQQPPPTPPSGTPSSGIPTSPAPVPVPGSVPPGPSVGVGMTPPLGMGTGAPGLSGAHRPGATGGAPPAMSSGFNPPGGGGGPVPVRGNQPPQPFLTPGAPMMSGTSGTLPPGYNPSSSPFPSTLMGMNINTKLFPPDQPSLSVPMMSPGTPGTSSVSGSSSTGLPSSLAPGTGGGGGGGASLASLNSLGVSTFTPTSLKTFLQFVFHVTRTKQPELHHKIFNAYKVHEKAPTEILKTLRDIVGGKNFDILKGEFVSRLKLMDQRGPVPGGGLTSGGPGLTPGAPLGPNVPPVVPPGTQGPLPPGMPSSAPITGVKRPAPES